MKYGFNLLRRVIAVIVLLLSFGTAIAAECAKCKAELPENARFCPMCGEKVAESQPVIQSKSAPVEKSVPMISADEGDLSKPTSALSSGLGSVKVSSSPINCLVKFRGREFSKKKPVMVIDNIPPGEYPVRFYADNRVVEKTVRVTAGGTAFVFGSLSHGKPVEDDGSLPSVYNEVDKPEITPENFTEDASKAAESGVRLKDVEVKPADTVPPVVPPVGDKVQDADDAYSLAETNRKVVVPWRKKAAYMEAKRLYEKVLERWPESDRHEDSLYRLAQIYESMYVSDYRKAIEVYKSLLEFNFHTGHDPRWRIAVLYQNRLRETAKALEWYEFSAKHSKDASVRKSAAAAATEIKKKALEEARRLAREAAQDGAGGR